MQITNYHRKGNNFQAVEQASVTTTDVNSTLQELEFALADKDQIENDITSLHASADKAGKQDFKTDASDLSTLEKISGTVYSTIFKVATLVNKLICNQDFRSELNKFKPYEEGRVTGDSELFYRLKLGENLLATLFLKGTPGNTDPVSLVDSFLVQNQKTGVYADVALPEYLGANQGWQASLGYCDPIPDDSIVFPNGVIRGSEDLSEHKVIELSNKVNGGDLQSIAARSLYGKAMEASGNKSKVTHFVSTLGTTPAKKGFIHASGFDLSKATGA